MTVWKPVVIKRIIHGEEVEIELTFDEMVEARERIEIQFMREDIQDMVDEIDPETLDRMAEQARDYVIYNDMSLREARDAVLDEEGF